MYSHTVGYFIIALSSCKIGLEPDDPGFADFSAAYTRWASQDFKEYSFEIHHHCICPPPQALIISVKDEEVLDFQLVEAEAAMLREYYSLEQLRELAEPQTTTIEELFSMIQENLQDNSVDEIRVVYNEQYGFPESIYIDPDHDYADEEINISIENFRADE